MKQKYLISNNNKNILLLPRKTMRIKHRFVYVGYNHDNIKNNEDNRNDDCYCLTCKKMIIPKIEIIKEKTKNQLSIYDHDAYMYICPECGQREYFNDIINNKEACICYRNYFIDENKLKISLCYLIFNIFNNKLVLKEKKLRITLNLDTGYSYIFAPMINKKIKQKYIKNITYKTDTSDIDNIYKKICTNKCEEYYDFYQKVYNEIRNYKMKKMNIYLPEENLEHLKNDYQKNNIYFTCLQKIFLLNRFPTIQKECLQNMAFSLDKDIKKHFKYLKHNSNNPIKDMLILFKISTGKKAKNNTILNINYPYYVKKLSKIIKSYDNINKILQDDFLKTLCLDDFKKLLKNIKYYKENYKFNENIFCNKFMNISEKDKKYLFNDIISMTQQIKNINKNYKIDTKLSFNDLHDILSLDYSKYKHPNKKIIIEEKDLKIEGIYNNLFFTLAKETHELIDVGSKMNICVGSYGNKAVDKRCNIVIVRNEKNEPRICIELDKEYKKIKQVKLKSNKYISKSDHKQEYYAVKQWVESNKLILDTYDFSLEQNYEEIAL